MIHLTRRYRFCSSHRLHSDHLSAAGNSALYGKCNNPFGHGHDYLLEVSVRGPVDPATGRGADLAALDALVGERILRAFDHRDLNTEVPVFAQLVPTTENLALEIRRRLGQHWSEAFPASWPKLERIRILETKRNRFELRQ